MSAGSASYSLLLASRGSTNSRISRALEFGWACHPGSHVRQASRGSSHDRHPFSDSGNAWGSHAGGNYWNA